VFDAQLGAEQVEQVRARGCALAQAEEAIRELIAVIGQDGADAIHPSSTAECRFIECWPLAA
jgi:hypothetical protein